ncbi:unnamed protein product [Phaedon cochleariae]|uniref:E3 ubiquitin-protein ligase SHPRH n=1 Tax=Phaedon cochleariae TaxID=80249 RepID=A0A9N9X103_PHACE|nr:unnamed protein product [Phaedon cochleariae]
MGRLKNVPKRKQESELNCGYYDYIPAIKKRRRSNFKNIPITNKFSKIQLTSEEHKQFFIGQINIGYTNNVLPTEYSECQVAFRSTEQENGQENDIQLSKSSFETILIQFDKLSMVIVKSYANTDLLKEIFSQKVFSFDFKIIEGEVHLELFFTTLPLPKFHPKLGNCIKTLFKLLYGIETDSGNDIDSINGTHLNGPAEIAKLFEKLSSRARDEMSVNLKNENVEHSCLIPKLRPYQEMSVRWMLHKEKQSSHESELLHPLYTTVEMKSGLTIYLDKYTGYINLEKPLIPTSSKGGILADEMGLGKTVELLACILLNPKIEIIKSEHPRSHQLKIVHQSKKPTVKVDENKPYISHLDQAKKIKVPEDWVKSSSRKSATRVALEMWYDNVLSNISATKEDEEEERSVQCICGSTSEEGTVECDCCGKYQHQECLGYKKSLGRYLCPQCWMNEPLLESGATLIVTPATLRAQWCKEICRHLQGDLKVLQYDGFNATPVYPTQLKQYHIVVTTYNVLQNELRLTENGQAISLRRERKYSHPGSPLTRIKWWRLCLDEAQTVETPGRMVSAMAKKIDAVYRWAVTGTPISKNVSDLYGLIDYLQITPYDDALTWKSILYQPYVAGNEKPMIDFLSQVLWRTCKKDVADQVNIPKQSYKEHLLEFSAVEKYFYKREHELISKDFLSKAMKFDSTLLLEKLDKSSLKKLLAPLYTLRHTCTQPNTVRGRYLATKKQVTSMQDLLNALILKNTTDSEDCLRLIISSLNGLAGLQLLLQNPQQAIDYYRQVLQLKSRFSEEHGEAKLTVDKPQVIHTLYNLAEVLDDHTPDQPTLRDCDLRKDCGELEEKYMEKFIDESFSAFGSFSRMMMTVAKVQSEFILKDGQWYSDGLDWIVINRHFGELVERIHTACDNASVPFQTSLRATSERSILNLIYSWDDDLSLTRTKLFDSMDTLYEYKPEGRHKIVIQENIVTKAMDCHLRPNRKSKVEKCPLCKTDVHLKMYEGKLFHMIRREKTFEDMSLKGSWKPKQEELILRSMLALLKLKNSKSELIKDGETHIIMVESLKKEFKVLTVCIIFLCATISALYKKALKVLYRLSFDIPTNDLYAITEKFSLDELYKIDSLKVSYNIMNNNLKPNFVLELRKLWTFLDQQICAQDELEICKVRLQLKSVEGVTKDTQVSRILKNLTFNLANNKNEHVNLLSVHELDYQNCLLRNEHRTSSDKLEKLLGTQKYLETLRKQQYEGQSPDPCPICKNALEQHWSILLCGHSYCLECIQVLLEQTAGDHIQCSVCRNKQKYQEISYIKAGNTVTDGDCSKIKGSYSTKIEGVVKLLLDLKKDDPEVKVLVFSSWVTVLKSLTDALVENSVRCEMAQGGNLEKRIVNFKDLNNVTALLLPVSLGSKGLNLIEATHVILVEPLLNPSDELQAIGRVNRIGQTKHTFVHKFLIKNTIEESIHQATTSNAENWDKNNVTLQHLVNLFTANTFVESEETQGFDEMSETAEDHADDDIIETEHEDEIFTSEPSCSITF